MRYFGSKATSIDAIYNLISQRCPTGSICDPFGGIGTVGSYFKSRGYEVWTGDLLTFAHYFQIAKIKLNRVPRFNKLNDELGIKRFSELIDYLNSLRPKSGWVTKEYSDKRSFFTKDNAMKIDSCRIEIKKWSELRLVSKNEQAYLLASLINSMDRVANTAGTYYAYLKSWNRKALKEFQFSPIQCNSGRSNALCFQEDANDLVTRREFDIVYLDPPYNERSYAHYYHLPESIATQSTPRVHGKSGIPVASSNRSRFNSKSDAISTFVELINNISCRLIFFHYADNGLLDKQSIRSALSAHGKLEECVIDSLGYKTSDIKGDVKHHIYMVINE